MTLVALLRELKERKIVMKLVDGKLQSVAEPGAITPKLGSEIKALRQELIEFLRQQQDYTIVDPVLKVESRGRYVASFAQKRLWFIDQFENDSRQFHISSVLRLRGKLNQPALQQALNEICRRHEAIRTVFCETKEGVEQVVLPEQAVDLTYQDLTQVFHDQREELSSKALREHADRSFNLATDLMLRGMLIKLSEHEHMLLITMHHIAADGWSRTLFIGELLQLYSAYRLGQDSTLPELDIQYGDYAAWQRTQLEGERLRAQLDYWTTTLDQIPQLHNLPLDNLRPAKQNYVGRRYRQLISKSLAKRLKDLALEHDATFFMVLEAAFAVLLARWSGEDDIVIGTPTAGRTRSELEPLIGFFVNTLVLRTKFDGDLSFSALLESTKQQVLSAFQHQELPFEMLVEEINPERSMSHSPIFQIMFVLQNNEKKSLELPDLEVESVDSDQVMTKYDLELNASDSESGLRLTWMYPKALFTEESVARLSETYERLLEAIVEDPSVNVHELSLLSSSDRSQLSQWSYTEEVVDEEVLLHQRFERSVRKSPLATALECNGQTMTYDELDRASNKLANYLRSQGVGYESLVGLSMPRSNDMIVAMLAILKSGGAFVALDPNYPDARLKIIIEDSHLEHVVCHSSLVANFPRGVAQLIESDTVVLTDMADSPLPDLDEEHGDYLNRLAYVIYTSGSTGRPKGVEIRHSALGSLINWSERTFSPEELAKTLVSTSLNFDLSMFEIFVPLSLGHQCVIVEDALALLDAPISVSLINTVPSAIKVLLEHQAIPATVKAVNLAGEPLSREVVNELLRSSSDLVVRNLYGPSEDTTYSTWATFDAPMTNQPSIGRPVANTRAYVLSSHKQFVPPGAVGELYLGGAGLARGYRNQPELTAERFVGRRRGDGNIEKLYRTGDLVRYLPNGELEFAGRVDDQLKIRGFRVEPAEIQIALNKLQPVSESIVVSKGEGESRQIIAYVVAHDSSASSGSNFVDSIRRELGQSLPDYMIPAAFIVLPAFPLTPNGKIDRSSLPEPDFSDHEKYVAPSTATETALADIWSTVLKLEEVSVQRNFFELGGHSLLATRVVSAASESLNVELPVRAVFEHNTVRTLAAYIDSLDTVIHRRIPKADRSEPLQLSFAQQRMWFIDQYDEGNSTEYNMPASVGLNGKLNKEALQGAFDGLIERHEVLRTNYHTRDGQAVQVVRDAVSLAIKDIDLSRYSESERNELLDQHTRAEAETAFSLESDSLLRVSVIKLSSEKHVLLFTAHHIAADGWSINLLVREFSHLYNGLCTGQQSALAELPVQYVDYAQWQRAQMQSESFNEHLEFWTEQLSDVPFVHSLPLDFPRPAVQKFAADIHSQQLSLNLTNALKRLATESDASLFMLIHAAFALLLGKWSNQKDVVVGTPVAGRHHTDIEPLIGCFINTLVLRSNLEDDVDFEHYLRESNRSVLAAFAHQECPFEFLVDELHPVRSVSHTPIFQIMLSLGNNERDPLELHGLSVEATGAAELSAKYDLDLSLVEGADGLKLSWVFATSLFEKETIRRLSDGFERLLYAISENPSARIHALPALPESDLEAFEKWNDTASPYPKAHFHEQVSAHAVTSPTFPAVRCDGHELTYAELDKASNQLARHLMTCHDIGPESLIGVCVNRSVDMVVATFAVWKAGGACVPLDPYLPAQRKNYILSNSGAKLVLGHADALAELDVESRHCVSIESIDLSQYDGHAPTVSGLNANSAAYITYTSGSTGQPKGVVIEHGVMTVKCAAWKQVYLLGEESRHLQMASFGFDVFMGDLIRSLGARATLVICPRDTLMNPIELFDLIERERIEFAEFVPAVLRALIEEASTRKQLLSTFKILAVGSDIWTKTDHTKLRQVVSDHVRVANSYGATEAGIDSSCFIDSGHQLEHRESVPIGSPVPNTTLYVVDSTMALVPLGVVGELCVGGDGLAREYLGAPETTEQKFVANPFDQTGDGRLYKTGDLVRWDRKGQLEMVGRVDTQIKVHGFRIEPGEIESALGLLPDIREAFVVAQGETSHKRLVAYVLSRVSATDVDAIDAWRIELRKTLPDYMVPAAFVVVDDWPLNANGKIDVKALPEAEFGSEEHSAYRAPQSERESALCKIWEDVLRVEKVGIDDNFFSIGGDSILSIQIVARANREGLGLSARQLFEHQTIAELGRLESTVRQIEAPQHEIEGELTLLPIQQRFFSFDTVDAHHDNQSLLLSVGGQVEREKLLLLVEALYTRHDALRVRFERVDDAWIARHHALSEEVVHASCNQEKLPEESSEWPSFIKSRCDFWQSQLNLSEGPLLRVVHFDGGQEHRLLIVIHHLLVDGVSWRILLADIQQGWQSLNESNQVSLGQKTSSLQQWSDALLEYSDSDALQAEREYWESHAGAAITPFPVDKPTRTDANVNSTEQVIIRLDSSYTGNLLHKCNEAYKTRINELLLAGTYLGLRNWCGHSSVRIDLEGHGREDLFDHLDISGTVGWFTTLFPLLLESDGNDPASVIKSVKERLRSVPNNGIGYGILKYLSSGETALCDEGSSHSELVFNYLGQLDQSMDEDSDIGAAVEAKGSEISPRRMREHLFGLNGWVSEGQLIFRLDYSANLHHRETIVELADCITSALKAVVDHCLIPDVGTYTPSDFPLATVSQGQLDQWQSDYSGIQTLYPAAPMQLGMLYHSLVDPSLYVTQSSPILCGPLDSECFRQAWESVFAHHDLFRTVFVGQDHIVHQLVVADSVIDWHEEDWSELPEDEAKRRFRHYQIADKQRGFVLDQLPLSRFALFKLGKDRHQLLWTHHHMLMDGWSTPFVYRDLMMAYQALLASKPISLPAAADYERYAGWLQDQDETEAEAFWQEQLAPLEAPTPLGLDDWTDVESAFAAGDEPAYKEHGVSLTQAQTQELSELARELQTTVNTLLQLAWAYLLRTYSGEQTVVFGATISGRPAEIENIDEMLGLFINTVPVCVNFDLDQSVKDHVQTLQHNVQRGIEYGYLSLTQIQRQSDVPAGTALFDSLIVFENYPMDAAHEAESNMSGLHMESSESTEHTNYKLTISADLRAQLRLKCGYWTHQYTESTVQRIMQHLVHALTQLTSGRQLAEIDIVTQEEKETLANWNDTAHPFDATPVFAHLEKHASLTPETTAVVFERDELGYAELNRQANALAKVLIDRGIGPEKVVGLYAERSVNMLVMVFAVWKAGGACLPLDARLPADRKVFMLEDSGATVLLSNTLLDPELTTGSWECVLLSDVAEALEQDVASVEPRADVNNAAYIIYTSGTTGRPKGVVVEHHVLASKLAAYCYDYDLSNVTKHLQVASFGFDVFMGDITRSVGTGATLVICPPDHLLDPAALIDLIDDQQIEYMDVVPAIVRGITGEAARQGRTLDTLKYLVVGADVWSRADHEKTKRILGKDTLFASGYGITETGIDSSAYLDNTQPSSSTRPVSIGKAQRNVEFYILDDRQRLAPIGVAGELYVGGEGQARGYLNQPELTAQRFLINPHGKHESDRFYRSGDSVRWRHDGHLEFIGRVDTQVKIRGYRIELSEIESQLGVYPGVDSALVLTQGAAPNSLLVAYVKPGKDSGVIEPKACQQALRDVLPEHMVPAAIVVVDEWPVNANGKIDRKKLPSVDVSTFGRSAHQAPRNEPERTLAQIWQDVLHVEKIGIDDNFFAIGGDSILSIQIVARANQAGLGLTARLLFEHPTVRESVARCGESNTLEISQEACIGELDLLPIQTEFLTEDTNDQHHYNQSALFSLNAPLDESDISDVLEKLCLRHDSLRLTFGFDGSANQWRAQYQPSEAGFLGKIYHRVEIETTDHWREACTDWQRSFDLSSGPLLRVVEFVDDQSSRLLIIAHHLVMDGVSWRILLADMQLALEQRSQGKAISLPGKTTSFQEWGKRLLAYSQSRRLRDEKSYWMSQLTAPVGAFHLDYDNIVATHATTVQRQFQLSKDSTDRLLHECGMAYTTQINELLLAAVYLAINAWRGQGAVRIELEGHGREDLFEDVDLSGTVGWFTTVFPLLLSCDDSDVGHVIKSIKEQHRRIPHNGIGYGLLKHHVKDEELLALDAASGANVLFNYLGQFDQVLKADGQLQAAALSRGAEVSSNRLRESVLGINAMVAGGQLSITVDYSREQFAESSMAALEDALLDGLESVVAHCAVSERIAATPSDFPLATVDQASLDEWQQHYGSMANIYHATVMQQGMLFHSLVDPGMYVLQTDPVLTGDLDMARFRQAWEHVVQRYDIFRTGFVGQEVSVQQLVVETVDLPWHEEDLTRYSPEEQASLFADFKAKDKQQGFDLTRPPLLRLAMFKLGQSKYQFLWTHHHMLMDGWSTPLVYRDVMRAYNELQDGPSLTWDEAPRYERYIEWLDQQSQEEALDHWRQVMGSREAATSLVVDRTGSRDSAGHVEQQLIIDETLTARLKELAKASNTTLNTVLQLAWGFLLHRYSGDSEVMFGTIISGRPADVPQVDEMVGLFINTVPVRTQIASDDNLAQHLTRQHNELQSAVDYGYVSLNQIKQVSQIDTSAEMFDSVWVFENYPLEDVMESSPATSDLQVSGKSNVEQTNYRLTLIVDASRTINIKCGFRKEHCSEEAVTSLLGHLNQILEQFPVVESLSEVTLLTAKERETYQQWNDTDRSYPVQVRLDELFDQQVNLTPNTTAVSDSNSAYTYRELQAEAQRLAQQLQARGVARGARVGVCLNRDANLVVVVLAVLKAGAAYVPIDPAYPSSRIAYMLDDSQADLIVTTTELAARCSVNTDRCYFIDDRHDDVSKEEGQPAAQALSSEDIAYVLYTSGSTGKPKAVEIRHRNAVAMVSWAAEEYSSEQMRAVLASTSLNFDLSVFEIFAPITRGGRCHVVPDATALVSETVDVSLINTVPSAIQLLLDQNAIPKTVNTVNLAGEPLPSSIVNRLLSDTSCTRVYNLYGPSEDTTYSTAARFDQPLETVPSIGRPIANTQAHILDGYGHRVPVGVAGELYLSGAGVAAGYLNRPELTAERFVEMTLEDGECINAYRTGDLVRYTSSGNIDFLGRSDDQVKVRGYRIELGEVQYQIGQLDGVREVLITKHDTGKSSQLVAYIDVEEVLDTDDQAVQVENWRERLGSVLPDYMIPAVFMVIEQFPRLPNGKVDRKRLPSPDASTQVHSTFRKARNPIEQTLCTIWQEVLGCERVGIDDSFFILGGDSILAIQIVARSRAAGLALTARHIFEHLCISEISPRVKRGEVAEVPQVPCYGESELLPIQQWLLSKEETDLHHYNQSVLLSAPVDVPVDHMRAIVRALLERHDALRLRFNHGDDTWRARFEPVTASMVDEICVTESLSSDQWKGQLRQRCDHWQTSLDLQQGPLLRLVHFTDQVQSRLLFIVHHLLVDAVSWRVLLADLQRAYEQLLDGQSIKLESKTTSVQQWGKALRHYARSEKAVSQSAYWHEQISRPVAEFPLDSSSDHQSAVPLQGTTRLKTIKIDRSVTQSLLHDCSNAYRTRIHELLLSAVYMALSEWCEGDSFRIDIEGHGREKLFDELSIEETVGWFTTLYPLVLHCDSPETAEVIRTIKESVRQVPDSGIGFGLLKYLNADVDFQESAKPSSSMVFNYLGQFDQVIEDDGHFGSPEEGQGSEVSARRLREHTLGLNGMVSNGELVFHLDYSDAQFDQSTITRLSAAIEQSICRVVAHCESVEHGGYTPSDFPLSTVSRKQLDVWSEEYSLIDKLYPATPMQQGMLYHSLLDTQAYVSQIYPFLNGELNESLFQEAWNRVVDRHDVFRTAFVQEGEDAQQLVVPTAALEWNTVDLSQFDLAEQRDQFERYRLNDKARGFNLAKPPLLRMTLFRLAESSYQLLWTHHHLLTDGWSLPLVYKDVISTYQALIQGVDIKRDSAPAFQDYVSWLQEQSLDDARTYWRDALQGIDGPAVLSIDSLPAGTGNEYLTSDMQLSEAQTSALRNLAQSNNVTANSVVQLAWGYLLQRYSGTDDVVFGATISGRPAEVFGVDDIVGLFINTIPMRVTCNEAESISGLLESIQDRMQRGIEYGYLSLADIQAQTPVAGGSSLFESLLVFENYPLDAAMDAESNLSDFSIVDAGSSEQTNYKLTISADLGQRFSIKCGYSNRVFSECTIRRLLGHLQQILVQLPTVSSLSDIELLTQDEHEWFSLQNQTQIPYCTSDTLYSLFHAQAASSPKAQALVFESETMSYAELDQRTDAIAFALKERDIVKGDVIGLYLERSFDMVAALLAVMKSGAAVMPILPGTPGPKIDFMLSDSKASLLLSHGDHYADLAHAISNDADVPRVNLDSVVASRDDQRTFVDQSHAETMAYLIYTSGSSGHPKGVLLNHQGLVNHVLGKNRVMNIRSEDVFLQNISYTFDPSIFELFCALSSGGSVVLPRQSDSMDFERLQDIIQQHEVTVATFAASQLSALIQVADVSKLSSVRTLISGGEKLSTALKETVLNSMSTSFYNVYGPTECSIESTWCLLNEVKDRGVPIGRAHDNVQLHVLDERFRRVPVGVPGELFIGGDGLAVGYLNRPELEGSVFLQDDGIETGPDVGSRVYRTGDQVRWRADGQLEFLGRNDGQVKIRGHRVELSEIEYCIGQMQGVSRAVVVVDQNVQTGPTLVAYVSSAEVMTAPEQVTEWIGAVRQNLVRTVANHMVPQAFSYVEKMPLNANGKVDVDELRKLPQIKTNQHIEPETDIEKRLAAIWSSLLDVERISITEDFFQLGGHSLLLTRMVHHLEDEFGVHVALGKLFEVREVQSLALHIGELLEMESLRESVMDTDSSSESDGADANPTVIEL